MKRLARIGPLVLALCLPAQFGPADEGPLESDPLFVGTLYLDIDTASYYEVVAWCRELGLSDSGSRRELQARLLKHYDLQPAAQPERAARRIEVERAAESEYFTIEEVDEKYVLLRGDVVVTLVDEASDVRHRIEAQRLLYNQSENTISGQGNITYTMTRQGMEEVFQAQRFTFDLGTWEGVFYSGTIAKERSVAGRTLTFVFTGDSIQRLEDDTVVLSDGRLTSSENPEDPYYHLKAERIWVLAPGEWALRNAVLYLGRVPVMYVPFFFYPGQEFFFHPSVGYRAREGSFLHTTIYLMGQKERKESPFSFLRITEQESPTFVTEVEGLFLKKAEGVDDEPVERNRFLKVLLDLYSRLGVFSGIEGSFPPSLRFKVGIGASRSVFQDSITGTYTPFYPGNDVRQSYWNSSTFFGLTLPIRYGYETKLLLRDKGYSLTGNFELYSDPYFPRDFYSRSEDMNWSEIVGLEQAGVTLASEKRNLTWEANGAVDISQEIASDLIQKLALSNLGFRLFWQSREAEGASSDPIASVDPSRGFYYPVSMRFPSAAFDLRGTLFSYPRAKKTTEAAVPPRTRKPAIADPGKGIRRVTVIEPPERKSVEQERFALRAPAPFGKLAVEQRQSTTSASIGYLVNPKATLERTFDSTQWNQKEDVDFASLYTTLEALGFSNLNYKLGIMGDFMSVSGAFVVDGLYRTRFNPAERLSAADWQSLRLGDYEQTHVGVKKTLSVSLLPLYAVPSLERTQLSYALGWSFFRWQFEALQDQMPTYGSEVAWSKEAVREHNAVFKLLFSPWKQTQSLRFSATLPPLDPVLAAGLDLRTWLFTTTVSVSTKYTENVWALQPLVLKESVAFEDVFSLEEEVQFDLEQMSLAKLRTSMRLYDFSAVFLAQRMFPVDPLGNPTASEEALLPSYVDLSYNVSTDPLTFWRDRIKLETVLRSTWRLNLQKFTDNRFDFTLRLNFFLYKFLELSVASQSYNTRTYSYIPGLPGRLPDPEPWVNPVYDLLRSFNFFDISDRYASAFKIRRLSINAIHHLQDWDLTFEYSGKPTLQTYPNGTRQYEWTPAFSVLIQWIPIPEIKGRVRGDTTGISIRG